MQVVWTFLARCQLDEIVHYIAQDNIDAALYIDNLICTAAEGLCQFPLKGKVGKVKGTRELVVHSNYILAYKFEEDTIKIIAVLHAARQYP